MDDIESEYIKRKSREARMASTGIQFDFLATRLQFQLRSTRYRLTSRYQRTFADLYLPRKRHDFLDPANEVISRGENVFVGWAQKQFGDNGHSLQPIRLFLMITASFWSLRRIELDSSVDYHIRQTERGKKRKEERERKRENRNPQGTSRVPSGIFKEKSLIVHSYIPENWIAVFRDHPLRSSLSLCPPPLLFLCLFCSTQTQIPRYSSRADASTVTRPEAVWFWR